MHAVEPHAVRFGAVGVGIRQRAEAAAVIPFLAGHRTGVAAHADVEIDDEAELARGRRGQGGHGCSGQNSGIRYIERAQKMAISGMPTFMKSMKR